MLSMSPFGRALVPITTSRAFPTELDLNRITLSKILFRNYSAIFADADGVGIGKISATLKLHDKNETWQHYVSTVAI